MIILFKSWIKWSQNCSRLPLWISVIKNKCLFCIVAFLDKFSFISGILKVRRERIHFIVVSCCDVVMRHWMVQLSVTNQINPATDSSTALIYILPICLLLKQI